MTKQISAPDSAPTARRPDKLPTAFGTTPVADALLRPHLPFSGQQILFISSCDDQHTHLLPLLKEWGLVTTACRHPTAIRQDRLQKFHVVVLCGPKTSWNAKDENRLVAGAARIIECEASHPMQPRVINARIIAVSWHSPQGILDALTMAIHSTHANPDSLLPTDEVVHFEKIAPPIRNAFLESARSSLATIKSSPNCKDVQRELHNLSGSLRFFDLVELSIRCADLESRMGHDGLAYHRHSLSLLELQLEAVIQDIQALKAE